MRKNFYSQNYFSLFKNMTESEWLNVLKTSCKSLLSVVADEQRSYRRTAVMMKMEAHN